MNILIVVWDAKTASADLSLVLGATDGSEVASRIAMRVLAVGVIALIWHLLAKRWKRIKASVSSYEDSQDAAERELCDAFQRGYGLSRTPFAPVSGSADSFSGHMFIRPPPRVVGWTVNGIRGIVILFGFGACAGIVQGEWLEASTGIVVTALLFPHAKLLPRRGSPRVPGRWTIERDQLILELDLGTTLYAQWSDIVACAATRASRVTGVVIRVASGETTSIYLNQPAEAVKLLDALRTRLRGLA